MSRLSPYFPTLNRRIVASKRHNDDVAFLVEAGSVYIFSFGRVLDSGLRILGQKVLSLDEALFVLQTVFTEGSKQSPILLETTRVCNFECNEILSREEIVSPYISTLEIFLSHQKTRGPNN